jgi:hypothetical protein
MKGPHVTDTTAPDDEARQVKPFAAFLQEHAGGRTHTELSERLVELVSAVQETGKGGTLTLIIGIKPTSKDTAGTVVVSDDVRIKKPAASRPASVFFVGADNNLLRNDPRQMQLPLRTVPDTTKTTPQEVAR